MKTSNTMVAQRPAQDGPAAQHQAGQIEGTFQCGLENRQFHYLASYAGSRSVDWHATVRCGASYCWSSGTIAHNVREGHELEQHVRAQVLSAISVMAWS